MKSTLPLILVVLALGAAAYFGRDLLSPERDGPERDGSAEPGHSAVGQPAVGGSADAFERFGASKPSGSGSEARFETLLVGDAAVGSTRRLQSSATRLLEVETLDPDGEPLQGVALTLYRQLSPWPNRRTEQLSVAYSNEKGFCRFEAPAGEDSLIEVEDERFARESLLLPVGLSRRTLRLKEGFQVSGRVLSSRRRPVAGVEVVLEPIGLEAREARVVTTDFLGRFRFVSVEGGGAGAIRVTARDGVHRPASRTNIPVGSAAGIQLEFGPLGESLRGLITDDAGLAVPGVEVSLFPSTAWNATLFHPFRTLSDTAGRFQLDGLGPGDARMVLRHPDFSVVDRIVSVHEVGELRFVLRPNVRVHGQLFGDLVPDLRLKLRSAGDDLHWASVDEDGKFEFADRVTVGPATLEVVAGRAAFVESDQRILQIELEPEESALRFEVAAPDMVFGRVVDVLGAPVENAAVSVRSNWWLSDFDPVRFYTTTDSTGRFEFRGLPIGAMARWVARFARSARPGRVEHSEFGQASFQVFSEGPVTDLGTIELQPPATIRGQVRSAGAPLAGVTVFASDQQNNALAVTDAEGRYELQRMAPGEYRLFARYSTLLIPVNDEPLILASGEEIDGLDLELPTLERVELRVVGETDEPIPEATVRLLGIQSQPVLTDADGRASLDVPEVARSFEVVSPTGDLRSVFNRDNENFSSEIRLRWLPRARVTGSIVAADGEVPRSAIFRLRPLEPVEVPEHVTQRTIVGRLLDLDRGTFEMWIPEGESMLTLDVPGYLPVESVIDPRIGKTTHLEGVRLQRGATIRGRVLGPDGEPLMGAQVRRGELEDLFLRPNRTDARSGDLAVLTDSEGRFDLSGIGAEARKLVAIAPGCSATELTIELPEDLFDGVEIGLPEVHQVEIMLPTQSGSASRLIGVYREGVLLDTRVPDSAGRIRMTVQVPGLYRFGYMTDAEGSGIDVEIGSPLGVRRGQMLLIDMR